jgi:hypothetical protein
VTGRARRRPPRFVQPATAARRPSPSPVRVVPDEPGILETLGERRAGGLETGGTAHRPGQVDQGRAGDLQVARIGPGTDHAETGRGRLSGDGAHQAGLPEAGLAGDEQQLAVAAGDLAQASIGQLEQVVATDDDGANEGTDVLLGRANVGR